MFIGASLREPHSYVLTRLFVTIYKYISWSWPLSDPAPGSKVGRCGHNLRVETFCVLFYCSLCVVWSCVCVRIYMLIHLCLRVRHWSNLSAVKVSICIRLSKLNESTNHFWNSQVCHQFEEAGNFFSLGAGPWENFLKFLSFLPMYLPLEKPVRRSNAIVQSTAFATVNSLTCELVPQPIYNSARKGRFLWQTTLLLGDLTWCCKRLTNVLTFRILLVNAQIIFIGKRKACPTRLRVLTWPPPCIPHKQGQPELVLLWLCVGCCGHAKYHNVARCVGCSLRRNFSAHQFCQSLAVRQPITKCILVGNLVNQGLPRNALHFPSMICQ